MSKKTVKRNKPANLFILAVFMFTIVFSVNPFVYADTGVSDTEGHWAQTAIQEMTAQGIIAGYSDGTFRPDNNITRAEFASLIVKVFNLEPADGQVFSDTAGHWAKTAIAAANYHGIVNGYSNNTFRPDASVTREEMAVMLINAAKPDSGESTEEFKDGPQIAAWAREAVTKAAAAGLIGGYPDGTFGPQLNMTRAEALVVLSRSVDSLPLYIAAGTYGPGTGTQTINNDVIISGDGVVLQNLIIEDDLFIAAEVGDGDVTLNNITVKGTTYVRGGGKDSIHINGGQYASIIVEKTPSGNVRIVATDVSGLRVVISENAAGETIITEGVFKSIEINAPDVKLETRAETKIENLIIGENAAGTDVSGEGAINEAVLYARDISFAAVPAKLVDKTTTTTSSGGGGSSVPTYTLAVSANPSAGGTVTGAGNYRKDAPVTLTATTNEGYDFIHWTLDGNVIGTDATLEYTMPAQNTELTALFIPAGSIPVATAEDLDSIRDNLEGYYVQVADIDLGIAPYNDEEGWEPIGNYSFDGEYSEEFFTGTFDGNGFRISNLMINYPNEDYIPVGLFGICSEEAELSNIALENVNVTGTWGVGGLTGDNYGSISGSSVTGSVYGHESVGGLAGDNEGTISDSYAACSVTGQGEDNSIIGGLVGANYGEITDSGATGSVAGESEAGGLAGSNDGPIVDSYAAGAVAGVGVVGGLAGVNWNTITDCYATGLVTGEYGVGGLVGVNLGTAGSSYALNPGLEMTNPDGYDFGRITGYNDAELTGNFARSDMTEPFAEAFAEKTADGKDGGDLYSWQIDTDGGITVVPEKSTYTIDADTPDLIVEAQEATLAVTMARNLPGNSGYDNVRVNVSAPGAASVQLPADWENGFAISPDYDTTADIFVLYSAGGEYTITLTLVDLDNGEEVLASESIELSVAYAVDSAEDLNDVRNNPGADYIQVADIDLSGIGWNPIGTYGSSFTGSYNGNGYMISNLSINSSENFQGLFGYIEGLIENVVLEDVSVVSTSGGIGGLAGYIKTGGTIKNSYVTGTVTGRLTTGLLAGDNWGTIEECSAVGFVNGVGEGYKESIGGLVGRNVDTGVIERSFAAVDVYSEAYLTGGLVGNNAGGDIYRSYAAGDVTATQSWAGGLVGDNRTWNDKASNISECYAVGKVTGGIGGLVGLNQGGPDIDVGMVEKSYYDTETTTMTDDEGKGIPKTTEEMTQEATFVDWDFDDTWTIVEGQTYPYFQWQDDN